jgi:hypothetical protein
MTTPKRCRGSNFTTEEELLLLDEIYKEKHVIECKTTNKVSNEEKVSFISNFCYRKLFYNFTCYLFIVGGSMATCVPSV